MPEEGLLIVEIKSPHRVKNGEPPDFIRLANAMKDTIDKMIRDGLDDFEVPVLGVLSEGKREHMPFYNSMSL